MRKVKPGTLRLRLCPSCHGGGAFGETAKRLGDLKMDEKFTLPHSEQFYSVRASEADGERRVIMPDGEILSYDDVVYTLDSVGGGEILATMTLDSAADRADEVIAIEKKKKEGAK